MGYSQFKNLWIEIGQSKRYKYQTIAGWQSYTWILVENTEKKRPNPC